jgi:hypothetical protein
MHRLLEIPPEKLQPPIAFDRPHVDKTLVVEVNAQIVSGWSANRKLARYGLGSLVHALAGLYATRQRQLLFTTNNQLARQLGSASRKS